MRFRWRRIATSLASLAFLLLATPAIALAHAGYIRSDPPDLCGPLAVPRLESNDSRCQTGVVLSSAPRTVSISFSEPVSLLGPGIRVLSPSGKRVDQTPARSEGSMASVAVDASEQGTYVVQWQVESADTHPARGQFAFSVGLSSKPAVSAEGLNVGQVTTLGLGLQTLSRWLHFGAYALAFGVLGFVLLAAGPIAPLTWRLLNMGIVLLLVAEPISLLGQTGSLGLDQLVDGDAMGDALASSFGRLMGFRIAAALLLWVITGSLRPATWDEIPNAKFQIPRQPTPAVASFFALGVALAVIDAFGQHAASFQPEWLGLIVHSMHLLSMGLWLGGLLALMTTRFQTRDSKIMLLAIGSLSVSLVTGAAMALVHVQTPAAIVQSTYGEALGVKQLFVLLAIGAGWLAIRWNSTLKIRTSKAAVLVESGALLAVLAAAGLLVSLPPPR